MAYWLMKTEPETFSWDDALVAKRVSDHLPVVAWFRIDEQFRDRPVASSD